MTRLRVGDDVANAGMARVAAPPGAAVASHFLNRFTPVERNAGLDLRSLDTQAAAEQSILRTCQDVHFRGGAGKVQSNMRLSLNNSSLPRSARGRQAATPGDFPFRRSVCLQALIGKVLVAFALVLSVAVFAVRADGPADNLPGQVRQVPPLGIEVSQVDRERLESGLGRLATAIGGLRTADNPQVVALLADVEIFHRAVDQALRFNEMFTSGDLRQADDLLAEGLKRAQALANTDPYWTRARGLVVRGFRSVLDDTVQPYGLVIPDTYRDDLPYRYRTDIWFHGRGEKAVELQFIHARMTKPGEYQPEDTIVLHPFGRYSNAFKFAGEVDVFEALDHAKANYRIDEDRISVRGFSMGGAAAWHFAVHYADRWFAANPGAGFSETPQFLQAFQGEVLSPTWWEQTLWRWYDCPGWVANLTRCPTIAYSGELDRQKQAADVMASAFRQHFGSELTHIVGPQVAHRIEPGAKTEIAAQVAVDSSA